MFPKSPAQWAYFLGSLGVRAGVAAKWAEPFAAACTPDRFNLGERELDDFMAETLHETAMLTATVEDLDNYSPGRIRELGKLYGPGSRWARAAASADALAGDGPALAEVLYGGRFGNSEPGDGWRYRGRGIPMVTFKANYARLESITGLPLVDRPELLEDREVAVRCAVFWWEDRIPDDAIDYPDRTRKLVQGGQLGLDHTRKLAAAARDALGALA